MKKWKNYLTMTLKRSLEFLRDEMKKCGRNKAFGRGKFGKGSKNTTIFGR